MNVLGRDRGRWWLVWITADASPVVETEPAASLYCKGGHEVEEVVPATTLRGAVEAERERIVAWLRERATSGYGWSVLDRAADDIEGGRPAKRGSNDL